jgi:hypothetical protein
VPTAVALIVAGLVCGTLGWHFGRHKGRQIEGLLLGVAFGLIGLLVLLFLKPKNGAATSAPAGTFAGSGTYGGAAAPETSLLVSSAPPTGNTILPGSAISGAQSQFQPVAPSAELESHENNQPVEQVQVVQQAPSFERIAPQAQPVVPTQAFAPAQWLADPSGRHQHRWWDGRIWTEHVANNGIQSLDMPTGAPRA